MTANQQTTANVHGEEVDKFDRLAQQWWDASGPLKTLHDINPVRMEFILRYAALQGKNVVDIGCGGGILSEALAQEGAHLTAIDLAPSSLAVARQHAAKSGLAIDYRHLSAEALAAERPASFDVAVCMEMLEHVPDPEAIVRAVAQLTRSGGWLFFSTLNRNFSAYFQAIILAEYLLNMVDRGTHEHARFIRPAELARMCRLAGLEVVDLSGMKYRPLQGCYELDANANVNYLLCARKP